ncbi:MAG: hypothetical protein K9L74_02485 [Candidatus Izimaplasma sp.]|nr:hypothetical protein [Candidatus Izimaplasma bacterium]
MKKLGLFFMLCIIFVSFSTMEVYANGPEYNEVEQFFISMSSVTPEWENAKIKKGDDIYGYGDVKIGYIYRVFNGQSQQGYILYLDNKGIIEATWEGTDLANEINGKVYYIFPGQYVSKKDFDELYVPEIESDKYYTYGTVARITADNGDDTFSYSTLSTTISQTYHPNLSSNVTVTSSYYSTRKTIDDVPDYTWRKGCTPTALANVIAYFDNEWHNSISPYDGPYNYPVNSENNYSYNLIDNLALYLNTKTDGGTSQPDLSLGWEDWLDDYNHSTYHILVGSFNSGGLTGVTNTFDYQTLISRGNPVVINVYGHATYYEHSLTGIGYVNAYGVAGVIAYDNAASTPREIFLNYSELDDYYFMYSYIPW